MVLCAVDDLLFSSKIRATAKQAGVELTFTRSPEEILEQARARKPALVIFDLNSGKTDPINTISALKAILRWPGCARSGLLRTCIPTSSPPREGGRRSGAAALGVRRQSRGHPAVLPELGPLITRQDVEAAARRIAPYVHRTPLRRSDWLSAESRADVSIKLEGIQTTFWYKVRGALNAVLKLRDGPNRPPALVTASAGNHGRGLAFAASIARLPLIVYVPEDAPRVKLEAIRRAGAELIACRDYDEAEARAKEHGAGGTALWVSPYSHPDVIAGAGTVGLEILEQDPGVEMIVCPVGGGGLISGTAIAAGPAVATWGVETESSLPFTHGLAAGHIVPIHVLPSLADGLVGNLDPETITFDLVRRHVAGIVTVAEEQIASAIAKLVAEERVIAEGASATAVAAVPRRSATARGSESRGDSVGFEYRSAQAARVDLA